MRIIGWVLTVLGCLWAFSGVMRVFAAFTGYSAASVVSQLIIGVLTLGLAWLAIWGGSKLRGKAKTAV